MRTENIADGYVGRIGMQTVFQNTIFNSPPPASRTGGNHPQKVIRKQIVILIIGDRNIGQPRQSFLRFGKAPRISREQPVAQQRIKAVSNLGLGSAVLKGGNSLGADFEQSI